ncbi:flavin reductase family protein [Streptococcus danieliae]|uniref:Flavin reductase n=2 Tax=Streptococcus danieliae TaxID=747656 RepID=A0A7X3KBP3_9STRE|nr:flavin reductase [Streptococcus danieliae]MBF0698447.1 flavin reductase [Streptococcus danieliae]MVX58077.1 flavin reductase family protein [Streptococcus danieliae]NYS95624.1 flavin reductase [Streptococcus danieliae]
MKETIDTRKLYFGFPTFFLGYKDRIHGYNISTCSSIYSLGNMLVCAMRTKSNAIQEISQTGVFSVSVPQMDLVREIEIAGFNSHKDKFNLTGLTYSLGEADVPLVDACPLVIECQVVEMVPCGALTNVIAKVTRRALDSDFITEDGNFRKETFDPISYIGDGAGRLYKSFSGEEIEMGSLIVKER